MRSLVDNFVTIIVFVIIIFTIISFATVEMQLVSARHLHSSAVNQVQSSFYEVDADDLNAQMASSEAFPASWHFDVEPVPTMGTRTDRLVRLTYTVVVPIFGIEKEGVIEGYAR